MPNHEFHTIKDGRLTHTWHLEDWFGWLFQVGAWPRSFGVLRSGGVLVATTSPPDAALAKAHRITSTFVFHQSDSSRLALIVGLLDSGSLKILVDRRTSLRDFAEAFTYQGLGRARGKIIVAMN